MRLSPYKAGRSLNAEACAVGTLRRSIARERGWGSFSPSFSVDESPDHPVPIIRHIDGQPRQIHPGELRADFIFRICREQRVIEISPENVRSPGSILIDDGLRGFR